MSIFKSGRFWGRVGIVVAALAIAQQIWHWEIERVEVGAGEYLVRIHRWGKNLEPDQIVAPDDSYKGVMLDVLLEGRHFLNPIFWSYERHKDVVVPDDKCLVLTRKFGKPIPEEQIAKGDILAQDDAANPFQGQRGIVRNVRGPGSHRLNPYAYSWEIVDAIQIKANEIGVRTLLVGEDPPPPPAGSEPGGRYVVPDGHRGIQATPLRDATYLINPYVERIAAVEKRAHRVELADIVFPSRDGFLMRPVVIVEYAVVPERAPEMLVRLSDTGELHQQDGTPQQQARNEILQKVILPHIRGYARIEGSNFFARDFITSESTTQAAAALDEAAAKAAKEAQLPVAEQVAAPPVAPPARSGNARERLQQALFNKVKEPCRKLGVEVRAVVIANMPPPEELSEQIAQRELAKIELAKNASLIRQYKTQQDLDAAKALKEQARTKVEAETRLIRKKTEANQLKEVAESKLTQELENAEVALEAAKKQAEALLTAARAEVSVIESQNRAEVAGLRTAVTGFASPRSFAQYHVVQKLAPALSEIFASDESEFAKIFFTYLKPEPKGNQP